MEVGEGRNECIKHFGQAYAHGPLWRSGDMLPQEKLQHACSEINSGAFLALITLLLYWMAAIYN